MNETLLSFCANIFGFVAGGVSLLSLAVAGCRPHLPSNKIKTLEALLYETETTFKAAVEAGLLVPEYIEKAEEDLDGLKEQTCSLRARAYNITTLGQDYAELLRGTSNAIGRTCQSVKKLRAEVITSSEERRCRPIQTEITSVPQALIPALPPNHEVRRPSNPSASTEIPRPRSCPPALSEWRSGDTPTVPIETTESHHRIQVDCVT